MKKLAFAILYTAGVALANPALADVEAASALREGEMKKLVFHEAPKPVGSAEFADFEGNPKALSELKGKWALVNFWATWCAPCREEMPALSALQSELGGEGFEVVTIATGRNPPPAMTTFFEEIGVDNLPLYRDPKSALAREMAVLGLPVTVLVNPEGQEVARITGDVDWGSDNAKAVLVAAMGGEG
ncbi:TlpA disulfide reductase family protein [Salipiger mangrovisoli]|uniref:TlpA family protein disulfide reductase n=1 Tax=Salipiger mangrovisoli TaxID=2865933 RepID=A0ABR9X280_9RHOB|nr:TlpA disulfide reductase family protein [Salipiger mangrovisoli]MBE9637556.1 TlpA family protein disulfide reductase [Salipiger mangrovisoli]